MAGRNAVVVPLIALLFGLVATALSFLAYAKRIKVEDVRTDRDGLCMYPSTPALAVGILAAVFVVAHQILFSVGSGCFCCGRYKFPCNFCGIIGLILFVLSWLAFVITFIGLVFTAIINDKGFLQSRGYTSPAGQSKEQCLKGKESLFLGAAIWCIINLFFNLASYAFFTCGVRRKHRENEERYGKGLENVAV